MKATYQALSGNEALAYAMKQINPDVVAAYPITPQTSLMEKFAEYAADGVVDTEMVLVESEHSAMSAVVGASAAGARAMTATSSQGLILMQEVVYIASGLRLPIVMSVANRSLSGPINIHCDHSDMMGARDSGWIQLFSENAQEGYDNLIQAIRIAEDPRVKLPVMVGSDGFIITHASENVQLRDDKDVKKFVGEYNPDVRLLDAEHPVTIGAFDLANYYFEHKRQQAEGMFNALQVIKEVAGDFKKTFGVEYGYFEEYRMKDAEIALVAIGSTCGTAKGVIDEKREKGCKAGLLKIRVFRPFPKDALAQALSRVKAVAILDRADSLSAVGGPLLPEIKSALYGKCQPLIVNYIYGLGGREIYPEDLARVIESLEETVKAGRVENELTYLGVR